MDRSSKIFVAGHRGMVGSALVRALHAGGYHNLLLRSRAEVDLTDGRATAALFASERPQYVVLAAARVGGIAANRDFPADFIHDNLAIALNVIHSAWQAGVDKLLFLGSSCIYPKLAPQPIREEALLCGPLEPTNEPYAVAKIAGIKLCQSYNRQHQTRFIACMPTNLYGPHDNFDRQSSHVVPALIRKFHDAKQAAAPAVVLWGDGSPRREFLHVDDLASACLRLLLDFTPTAAQSAAGDIFVNVGTGQDLTIAELAAQVQAVVGYRGDIVWDPAQPNGTPRKLLEVSKLRALGWAPQIGLADGLATAYAWFLAHIAQGL
jgi:GDP-L-fucose synthase